MYFAVLRTAQFAAAPPRRTATRRRLAQPSAVGEQQAHSPKFASEISKDPPKTRKIAKKARKLLYDTIICTTFGASDPSECDVNRVAAPVNLRNLQ